MQDKKQILKRTISFITAVSVISCYYSVPFCASAADTTTATSETKQTSVTTTSASTTAVTTMATAETTTNTTKAEYTYTVNIGGMDINNKNEAYIFYGRLFTADMHPDNNGKIKTEIAPEELKDLINKDNIIDHNGHNYKFSEISNYIIKLDEYFKVDMEQNAPVLFTESVAYNNNTYLKKDSTVTITANQDWILQKKIVKMFQPDYFETVKDVSFTASYSLKINTRQQNGLNYYEFSINGTDYKVIYSSFSVNFEDNYKDYRSDDYQSNGMYLWKDRKISDVEGFGYKIPFNINATKNGYIQSVTVTSSDNTPLIVCRSNDDKYTDVNNTDLIKNSEYNHNAQLSIMIPDDIQPSDNCKFTVSVEIIPEIVTTQIKKYSFKDNQWITEDVQSKTSNNGSITAPRILKDENNQMTHILMGCDISPEITPTLADLVTILSNPGSVDNSVSYSHNKHTFYYLSLDTKNVDVKPFKIIGTKSDKNNIYCVSVNEKSGMIPSLNILSGLSTAYEIYGTKDMRDTNIAINSLRKKYNEDYPEENHLEFLGSTPKGEETQFVIIRSICDYIDSDEYDKFANYLSSPLYLYVDRLAPQIKKAFTDGTEISDKLPWSKNDITFSLNIDDRNKLDKNNYTDELYNNFNNVASKTAEITIGNYIFKINDGVITKSKKSTTDSGLSDDTIVSETADAEYNNNLSDCNIEAEYTKNQDGTETVTFKITTDKQYIKKDNVNITVTDSCGNKSGSFLNIWIDKTSPYLKTGKTIIDGFDENLKNIVSTGRDVEFRYEASDAVIGENEGSGIKSVIAEYISENTHGSIKKNDADVFEWNRFKNSKGKIKVTVTDNAGNSTEYFYKDGALSDTADITTADTVIFDNTAPDTEITNSNELNNKWFASYPEIKFRIKDKNISSGISNMYITVNGVIIPAEFTSTKDNEIYTLSPESYISILTDEKSAGYRKDGKIEISAYSVDAAGNNGNTSSVLFSVDDKNPLEPDAFRAEDSNVQIRSFGVFYNNPFEIKVDIKDNSVHSSGISKAVLELDGKEYVWENRYNPYSPEMTAVFNIDQIPVISKSPSVTVYDNVGHISKKIQLISGSVASNPGIKSLPYITIEKNSPEIGLPLVEGENHYIKNNNGINEDWYSSDVNISYSVSDVDSGLSKVLITRNNNDQLINDDYTGESEAVTSHSYSVSTPDGSDGYFTFDFSASDNASNNAPENTLTVYKDITAPEITGFSFDSSDEHSVFSRIPVPYFYFFGQASSVTVHAKDNGASSGIKNISLKFEGINAPDIMTKEAERDENGDFRCTFEIPEGFKGVISAKATDNVNNSPDEWKSPRAYVSEEGQRHSQTSSLSIKLPETSFTDRNGLPLYNTDIDASLTAEDSFSGLHTINVQSPDFNDNVLIQNSESVPDISGWQTEAADINIINRLSRIVRMSSNLNGNKITIDAEDNSGNKFTTASKEFSIDKTNPEISVSFDNNSSDSTYKEMYNTPRNATVKIKERNFDPSKVSISPSYSHGDWKLVSGEEGTDSAVYQTVISFASDGTYSFTVDCKDMCENAASQYKSPEFTIDLTSPELKVTYDRNDAKNGNYYKNAVTATIEVSELNFDPSRINITGTKDGSADNFPVKNGKYNQKDLVWNNTGKNTWVTSVHLNEDGYYELKVSGTDKAGNPAKSYSNSFFIDKSSPSVKFSGITDSEAYNGDVLPVVEITDENLDFDTIKLTMQGSKRGLIKDIAGNSEKGTGKYTFAFDNFPDSEEYDDIYTITAEATDFAGNVRTSSIKFSVNRFGSTFEPEEKTALLQNKYIYEPQDIIINEINVDPHPDDFVPIVTLSKDGSGITLKQGKDYSLEPVTDSSTGWILYKYVIKSENFTDDAVYEISIYSEDEAENKNNGASVIKFGIDKTQPSVNFVNIENNGTYKTDSKKIITLVEDNMGVDSVEVYINGSLLDIADFSFDAETSECRFNLPSSNSSQSIEVIPVDLAGNKADSENSKVENVLVSTNIARIMLHKTWFKIVSAAAVVIAGASAFIFIRRKRKLSE